MKIRLGYVALPISLDDKTFYRTMTFSQFQKLGIEEGLKKIDFLIHENFKNLQEILDYNCMFGVAFYRMSQSIIPLATHIEVPFDYLTPYQTEFKAIGDFIKKNHMRVDTHPDQFCVLNSTKKGVVKQSIEILEFHQSLFEAMGITSKTVLHIGGGIDDKVEAMKRFKKTFLKLKKQIKENIILENDDKVFTVEDTLFLCEDLGIPMVLDYHHYICNKVKPLTDEMLVRIIHTWDKTNLPPKMHFSSPKSQKEKRSHSDYINYKAFVLFLKRIQFLNTDIDIMLEAKAKDATLFRLARQLKFKTDLEFITPTTFLLHADSNLGA